jgi:hypothetical protein
MQIENANNGTPESKRQDHEEMLSKLKKHEKSTEKDVISMLKNKSFVMGSPEKNKAISLIEKSKLLSAVPALYALLNTAVITGVGEKNKSPVDALIAIGKDGLPSLLECIEQDKPASVPYQTIAAILFHWFDEDKTALKKFLSETEKKASAKNKSKFSAIIKVVDNWK